MSGTSSGRPEAPLENPTLDVQKWSRNPVAYGHHFAGLNKVKIIAYLNYSSLN